MNPFWFALGGVALGWLASLWLALCTERRPAVILNMCAGGGGAALAVWLRQSYAELALGTGSESTLGEVTASLLGALLCVMAAAGARQRTDS
jgi:uncharacterized membrane protein YeaQ/YmgE (transglycosylase-associated protein family)